MLSSHECPRIVDLIVPMCDAVANLDRPRSRRHINNTSQARVVDAPRRSFACKPILVRRKDSSSIRLHASIFDVLNDRSEPLPLPTSPRCSASRSSMIPHDALRLGLLVTIASSLHSADLIVRCRLAGCPHLGMVDEILQFSKTLTRKLASFSRLSARLQTAPLKGPKLRIASAAPNRSRPQASFTICAAPRLLVKIPGAAFSLARDYSYTSSLAQTGSNSA